MIIMFFFNDTATTEIYTLSLHDALPIFDGRLEVFARDEARRHLPERREARGEVLQALLPREVDRKSTRLNSSHANISYAVFCLKKKTSPKSRHCILLVYLHLCITHLFLC